MNLVDMMASLFAMVVWSSACRLFGVMKICVRIDM